MYRMRPSFGEVEPDNERNKGPSTAIPQELASRQVQVGGRITGMSSSRQESVADVRAKSEAQAAKLAHSGKTMALLCLDRNASRAIKWAQFERFLAQLSSVLHFFFILLFIPLIFLAWTGRPFNMPAAGLILQYMVLILSIIKMFWPTLKKMYLRQAKKASKREVVVTVAFSTLCIFSSIWLYFFGRGFNGYIGVGQHDWQRAVMVWAYWFFRCARRRSSVSPHHQRGAPLPPVGAHRVLCPRHAFASRSHLLLHPGPLLLSSLPEASF